MELKTSTVVAAIASVMMLVQTLALPMTSNTQDDQLAAEKRPKYMDTRDLTYFKDLLMYTIQDLVSEGQLNGELLAVSEDDNTKAESKRGRAFLGLCLRRTSSGLRPQPCWKNEGN